MGPIIGFVVRLAIGASLFILIVSLPVYKLLGLNKLLAFLWGAFFSLFITAFAFAVNSWAFRFGGKSFYRVVLGGMFLRFLIVGIVLFGVWRYTQLHLITFLISLMAFYVLFQAIEIRYFQKNLLKKNR